MHLINKHVDSLMEKVDTYLENGSGWAVLKINSINIMITKYSPISSGTHLKLPPGIKGKKALVNVYSRDEKCLLWCLLAYKHPEVKPILPNLRLFQHEVNMDKIAFPTPLSQLDHVEDQNGLSITGWFIC